MCLHIWWSMNRPPLLLPAGDSALCRPMAVTLRHFHFVFFPLIMLAYPHTSWEVISVGSCSHPNRRPPSTPGTAGVEQEKGLGQLTPYQSLWLLLTHFASVLQSHLLPLRVWGALRSSRVWEITWNGIEGCSGKASTVWISCATKPRPGLNDVINIQLHLTIPGAFCWASKSHLAMSPRPLCEDKKDGSYESLCLSPEGYLSYREVSLMLKWAALLGFLDMLHKPRRLWTERQKRGHCLPIPSSVALWKEKP